MAIVDDHGRELVLKTPRIFVPLLAPGAYKGAVGGRSSGKSHFYAEMLIERCILRPRTRWVCLREIQDSLKQSVKLLLTDKIKALNVGRYFQIWEDRIDTHGGGVITFQGMQNHTADSIKSLEDYDGGWFEEAHRASAYSLSLLRPTIRKDYSDGTTAEMWFSWNRKTPKDPIDVLLCGDDPPPRTIVVEPTYWDNPFLPNKSREEMEYDKRRDPDRYAHVWLGQYEKHSQARVFHNWREERFETPRNARFRFGGDFGFAKDPTVLIRCFTVDRTLYIDREAWKIGCEVDHIPALYAGSDERRPERWKNPFGWEGIEGSRKWPLILDSSDPQIISYLNRHGFENAKGAIKGPGSIEEGVKFLKSYDIVVHPDYCPKVIDELSTYSYEVDQRTEEVLPILADKKNHTIDSMRYAIESERRAGAPAAVTGSYQVAR